MMIIKHNNDDNDDDDNVQGRKGVRVLQFTMLLPFKYVNDPNWLKTTKSIFMLDLWVSFNTCTKSEDLVNALYMYLEDYSLALFFSFVLATVYLCIYCHTVIGIYLFIYLLSLPLLMISM